MHRSFAALLTMALLLQGCSKSDSAISSYLGYEIPTDSLDSFLKREMQTRDIPGLAVAYIDGGKLVYHKTYGYANVEENWTVTGETLFEGASISKSVFAFFVMTFVEEGKLDLDRPLYEYYPHPDLSEDKNSRKITARMVLSHRSGLPNWREDDPEGELRLHFAPGTDYLYSGEGYQYLAEVLCELEQTDWAGLERLFQERIGKPAGLRNTVFIQNSYTKRHMAQPYDENGNRIDWENDYWYKKSDGVFVAPASIRSEPLDFSRWMSAFMEGQILQEESYKELLKPHSSVPYQGIDIRYTLGFFTPRIPFTEMYYHSGNNIGFTSWFAMDRRKKWGFVMFANSDNGEALGEELFFYSMVGPNTTKPILTLVLIALLLLLLLWGVIRYTLRAFKDKHRSAGNLTQRGPG